MRPLILFLIVLGQTGCLLAPSRPSRPGGDDDSMSDLSLGVSVGAALDQPDRDTLIRAAHVGDDWYLYLYPSTTRTSQSPERTFQLTGDGIVSIDAIEPAVVTGTVPDLLVLVSFASGDSAVIDVRSVGGVLSEVGRVVASGYHPIPIETRSGLVATGFIALRANAELWFGGGRQGIAVASFTPAASGIRGTATATETSRSTEGWYHAVAVRKPHGAMNFALIGTGTSYEATANSSFIDTTDVIEHDLCAMPPECHGRLAFTLSAPSSVDTVEAFSIDRMDGTFETIASDTVMTPGFDIEPHLPVALGAGSVLDAASGELVGDARTDVAMLWGSGSSSRELIVYEAMLASGTPAGSVIRHSFNTKLDRVKILRTGGANHILLLSDDPHTNPEYCLQMIGATFVDCP